MVRVGQIFCEWYRTEVAEARLQKALQPQLSDAIPYPRYVDEVAIMNEITRHFVV